MNAKQLINAIALVLFICTGLTPAFAGLSTYSSASKAENGQTTAVKKARPMNHVYLRYKIGRDENDVTYHQTYNILETGAVPNWLLGTRIVTADNGFKAIIPHAYYDLGNGFSIGAKYLHVTAEIPGGPNKGQSVHIEKVGPALRFKGTFFERKLLAMADFEYFVDTNEGTDNDQYALWLMASTMRPGWNYSSEFRAYKTADRPQHFDFRPVNISYRFKNGVSPFVMYEHTRNDDDFEANAVMCGLNIFF